MINFTSCLLKVELICLLLIRIAIKIYYLIKKENVHKKGIFFEKETIGLQKYKYNTQIEKFHFQKITL